MQSSHARESLRWSLSIVPARSKVIPVYSSIPVVHGSISPIQDTHEMFHMPNLRYRRAEFVFPSIHVYNTRCMNVVRCVRT